MYCHVTTGRCSFSIIVSPCVQPDYAKASTKDWKIGDVVAGQARSGGGLTFVAVEGAGHMVPMDQPQAVSYDDDMMTLF